MEQNLGAGKCLLSSVVFLFFFEICLCESVFLRIAVSMKLFLMNISEGALKIRDI